MRILITTGIFRPEAGGPATFAAEFAKRLQKTGHKVAVITYSNQPHYESDKEFPFLLIRILRSSHKLLNYLRYFWQVYQAAPHFDFIYSLDWFSAGLPVMIAARMRNKKYALRVGGGYIWEKYLSDGKIPVTLKEFYARGLQNQYYIMFVIIRRVFAHASFIIFNSDAQRELYVSQYALNPHKVGTVYNAITEPKISGLVKNYKTNISVPDHEIVFAGRFIKMKNIETLIEAFARLPDTSFNLVLIGEGPTESELRSLVTKLSLTSRVEFLPLMNQTDLYKRIMNSYLFVLPSWTDIAPHQIYECRALNIPFLLTRENYLPIAKQLPLTINPHSVDDVVEKITMLLDPMEYQRYSKALQHIQVSHSWDNVLVEHMKIFKTHLT